MSYTAIKFRPMPSKTIVEDIVVSVETAMKRFSLQEKMAVRRDAGRIIKSQKLGRLKLSPENEAIRDLKARECVYLPPDKGKGTVAWERDEYRRAALEHLQ